MPAHYVCLSDMHLGYEKSVLNDPAAQDHLIDQIAKLCGGSTDRLIFNGDCFEGCIPLNAGEHDPAGFNPSMAAASRSFLQKFTDAIHTTSLVLLWGNHDYCLWQKVAASCGVSPFTNNQVGNILLQHEKQILPGAEGFIGDIIGTAADKFMRIRSAYPNYVLGRYWPFTVFHHGQFLDRLVLGWYPDIDYLPLKIAIGVGQPRVSRDGTETVESIHQKTCDFIGAMWKINSKARAAEWAILRRMEKAHNCHFYPAGAVLNEIVDAEAQDSQIGEQIPWYLTTLQLDATTPSLIGSADGLGHLVIGHDHNGGRQVYQGLDGHFWQASNTGGWTSDRDEKAPHAHVLIHIEDAPEPSLFCIKI